MIFKNVLSRSDMISCLLCLDPPCSEACPKGDPAKMLKNVWFDNQDIAAMSLPCINPCVKCDAPCEKACISKRNVQIKNILPGYLMKLDLWQK